MNARIPLYAKIICWLFLNLALLFAGALIFFGARIQSGAELLVSTFAGTRLQALARLARDEIAERPRGEWDGVLARFSQAYRWEMYLFRNDGGQVAGERVELPAEVFQRLGEPRFGPRGGRFGMREGRPPFSPEEEPGIEGPPEGPGPERREPLLGGGPGPRMPRFVVKTREPREYWIALPIVGGEPGRRPAGPMTLLLRSKSLNAGGLVMDTSVWLWSGAGAVAFSILLWFPLVHGITRSIRNMKTATSRIAEGKFDARVDERRRDELGELSAAINRMASRLDGFVTGQKRFLGDIAHELCSPIARMQMALGILEQRSDPNSASYVADVREEIQHMSTLVNELLSFSKASLAARQIRLEPIDIGAIAERAISRDGEGLGIRKDIPEGTTALGDPDLLLRALSNLIRNAVRYAGHAGRISITAAATNESVAVTVADSGPGVPESELPKLFDPFYRVDTSRARETGGVGLGLAIVKTCVESCRGSVGCRNRPQGGFEVTMTLSRA